MPSPQSALGLDQDLRFGEAVEDFAIKQLITQAAARRFTITILPRAARRYLKRLNTDLSVPLPDGGCDKFGAPFGEAQDKIV
jgi:hypothetical protein